MSLFSLHSRVTYKEVLAATTAEQGTTDELLPGRKVVLLTKPKGQKKSRYNLTLNERMRIIS